MLDNELLAKLSDLNLDPFWAEVCPIFSLPFPPLSLLWVEVRRMDRMREVMRTQLITCCFSYIILEFLLEFKNIKVNHVDRCGLGWPPTSLSLFIPLKQLMIIVPSEFISSSFPLLPPSAFNVSLNFLFIQKNSDNRVERCTT